jgi:threonine dehydratase
MTDAPQSTTPSATPKWAPLDAPQRRVLGVLVEKAKTTPAGYPMTVHAIVTGANQKNNREPVTSYEAFDIEKALSELQELGAVQEIDWLGRVPKYKHRAHEWLGVTPLELAVLTELLLRGPQTLGDLRARASRMEPIADLPALKSIVAALVERDLMVELTPAGRGQIVSHNLYPASERGIVSMPTATSRRAAVLGDENPATEDKPVAPGEPIPIENIRAAATRIALDVLRTPLVRLDVDAPAEIWLKLENLQATGSFKLRGASNAIALAPPEALAAGVWTASAGNMAQGVAWQARRLGIPCTVVAPDHAPEAKLAPTRRLGARIVTTPFESWYQALTDRRFPGVDGYFVHSVSDPAVMAGNGTIGLEILADLPDVDAILVPFGGGGLSCGIASAVRALQPETKVYACEVDTSACFAASLAAGAPTRVDYRPSFVDGIGAPVPLPEMWPLAQRLLAGSLVSSLAETASAIRTLVERSHVVAEGAGGAAVAPALAGKAGTGKVVCVISGANIDPAKLVKILSGEVP